MTDRRLPIVDDAPACPFVAFDDDREERASVPDERHRCYAEARPAQRAAAHQDAYCLSSGFTLCPTFVDWAKREGARIREEPTADLLMADDNPSRNPSRGWAAPPPWLGGSNTKSEDDEDNDEQAADPRDFLAGRGADAGLAGSPAHQIALESLPPTAPQRATGFGGGPNAFGAGSGAGPVNADDDDDETDDDVVERNHGRPSRGSTPPLGPRKMGGLLPGRDRPKVGDTRPRRRGSEAEPPPWERQHGRYDAYPTLKTRMGLPAIPRVVLLGGALVLAMVALFMLPSFFGLGRPGTTPGPSVALVPTAGPSTTAGPSVSPAPRTQTYVVVPGDTMSKIAAKVGVTLADLVAANKDKYPNPDKIAVGDVLVVPAAVPTGFSDAGSPAPSTAPKASPVTK